MAPQSRFLDSLERVSRKGSPRWRSHDGDRYFEWDAVHGEVEVYNKRGRHIGVADRDTGVFFKEAVKRRRIDV